MGVGPGFCQESSITFKNLSFNNVRLLLRAQERPAENDVILIRPEVMFVQKLVGIQLPPELTPPPGGIRNLHPESGEPRFFADAASGSMPDAESQAGGPAVPQLGR